MRSTVLRVTASWYWLVGLFTVATFVETVFNGHMLAFTPLYLPRLGVADADVSTWTGAAWAISAALGLPFLPLWGALADRYARQPITARSWWAIGINSSVRIGVRCWGWRSTRRASSGGRRASRSFSWRFP